MRVVADFQSPGKVVLTCEQDGQVTTGASRLFIRPTGLIDSYDAQWQLEPLPGELSGGDAARQRRTELRLDELGQELFESLFGVPESGPARELVRRPECELVIRSSDAEILAIPWELIREPGAGQPLALTTHGVTRAATGGAAPGGAAPGPTAYPLRVLMVIARPGGQTDIRYRSIADPLLQAVRRAPGPVDLTVLRPPTIEALEQRLRQAREQGRPYGVLHLDVHGELTGDGGTLLLEGLRGGAQRVDVGRLAAAVAAGKPPLVVLNACESGAVGRSIETAIAARLADTAAVVAMGFRMPVTAAATYVAALYERLLAGDEIAVAVRAGRVALAAGTRQGEFSVPVLYRSGVLRFDRVADVRPVPGSAPEGDTFVGRHDLFWSIEVALRSGSCVLLTGMAGIGKSELATAFTRWWSQTGGNATDRTTTRIVFGPDGPKNFGQLLERIASGLPSLLVLDGLETLRRRGTGWPDADLLRLVALLDEIRAVGSSKVLITTRGHQGWLGDVRRLQIPPLPGDEAAQYWGQLRGDEPAAVDQELIDRELGGHPLAISAVQPLGLDAWALRRLLRGEDLDQQLPPLLTEQVEEALGELPVEITSQLIPCCLLPPTVDLTTLDRLMEAAPRFKAEDRPWPDLLAIVGEAGLITDLGAGRYRAHPALSAVQARLWRAGCTSDEAFRQERAEILDRLGRGIDHAGRRFLVRSGGLTGETVVEDSAETDGMTNIFTTLRDLADWAGAGDQLRSLQRFHQRHGLTSRIRETTEQYEAACREAFEQFPPDELDGVAWLFLTNRRYGADAAEIAELVDVCEDIRRRVEREPRSPDRQRRLLAVRRELARLLTDRRSFSEALDQALQALAVTYDPFTWRPPSRPQLVDSLLAGVLLPDDQLTGFVRRDEQLSTAASILGELSSIAFFGDDWTAATEYAERELAAGEALGDQAVTSSAMAHHAQAARGAGDFAGARRWYLKALDLHTRRGRPTQAAKTCARLAGVALLQLRLQDAEDWYRRARRILLTLPDSDELPWNEADLGEICRRRGRLVEAEAWNQQALERFRLSGEIRGEAKVSAALGRTAFDRGDLTKARFWHETAVRIGLVCGDDLLVAFSRKDLAHIRRVGG
jgi:tetratricopeptide (TPR) repeat protein